MGAIRGAGPKYMQRPKRHQYVVECQQCGFRSVERIPSGWFPDGSLWWPWLHNEPNGQVRCMGSFDEAITLPPDQVQKLLNSPNGDRPTL